MAVAYYRVGMPTLRLIGFIGYDKRYKAHT
jgi:hypothetical protein